MTFFWTCLSSASRFNKLSEFVLILVIESLNDLRRLSKTPYERFSYPFINSIALWSCSFNCSWCLSSSFCFKSLARFNSSLVSAFKLSNLANLSSDLPLYSIKASLIFLFKFEICSLFNKLISVLFSTLRSKEGIISSCLRWRNKLRSSSSLACKELYSLINNSLLFNFRAELVSISPDLIKNASNLLRYSLIDSSVLVLASSVDLSGNLFKAILSSDFKS